MATAENLVLATHHDCAQAGCNEPATELVIEGSNLSMLFATGAALVCKKHTAENIGGVRIPLEQLAINQAIYRLDVEVEFLGPLPEKYNKAAPEVTEAHRAAVEAMQDVLREHGFTIGHTGHGSLRIGTVRDGRSEYV
jgi:hypothetical protein